MAQGSGLNAGGGSAVVLVPDEFCGGVPLGAQIVNACQERAETPLHESHVPPGYPYPVVVHIVGADPVGVQGLALSVSSVAVRDDMRTHKVPSSGSRTMSTPASLLPVAA